MGVRRISLHFQFSPARRWSVRKTEAGAWPPGGGDVCVEQRVGECEGPEGRPVAVVRYPLLRVGGRRPPMPHTGVLGWQDLRVGDYEAVRFFNFAWRKANPPKLSVGRNGRKTRQEVVGTFYCENLEQTLIPCVNAFKKSDTPLLCLVDPHWVMKKSGPHEE